jgi:sugar phosphate permease
MPGLAYYLSCFYRRNELLLRIGFFINGACLAGGFGGLLAAGLSQIPSWGASSNPIHTWRNIFLFEGLLTVIIGLGAMHYTVNTPLDCSWLSDRQRHIAAERINQEYQEGVRRNVTKNDIYRGIFNINTIICGLCFMVRIPFHARRKRPIRLTDVRSLPTSPFSLSRSSCLQSLWL